MLVVRLLLDSYLRKGRDVCRGGRMGKDPDSLYGIVKKEINFSGIFCIKGIRYTKKIRKKHSFNLLFYFVNYI